MEHESLHILVIDPQAERSQEINSLLRNSGINVRVFHAADGVDMERLLREKQPAFCLLHPSAVPGIPLQKICESTDHQGTLLAVLCTPQDLALFKAAMEEHACIGVNADDPGQLVWLVRHFAQNSQTGRELARLKEQIAELQSLHELLLRSTGDAIAYVHEGLHIAANAPYRAALGIRDESELVSLSVLEVLQAPDRDLKALVRDLGQGRFPPDAMDMQVRPVMGESFAARVSFSPAQYEGEPCVQLKLQATRETGEDAGALPHAAAGRDSLTGTPDRAAFLDVAQQRLDAQPERQAALLYLQPDDAERLVHRMPPAAFDHYVRALAKALSVRLEPGDLLCRWGDCTFALLAWRDDREALTQLGEGLRADVANVANGIDARNVPRSASVGLSMPGAQEHDVLVIVDQARTAWEQAAEQGDDLQRYRPSRGDEAGDQDDADWVERLRYAIDNDDFYSIQQVIVNLEGDGEGLFENRTWLHEDDGDQPMEAFIAVAERNELASTIDRQVIPGLLSAISGSGDRHILNISANSVQDFSFPAWFLRQLQANDVEGRQVILQMSEHAVLQDLRATRRLIDEISTTGCAFSVAGVRGGKQHDALPTELDLAFIKLDPSVIGELASNPATLQAVRHLVSTATEAGTHVLADQVRNSADMATLWQCGIKHLAGDFLQESNRSAG